MSAIKDAKILNNATYNDYYNRLKLLALSRYEWIGLPDTCNARYLEKILYSAGKAAFVKDERFGFLNLMCAENGQYNFYDLPTAYQVYSNTYNCTFSADECVIIRNNYLEINTGTTIGLYARRLFEAARTLDVNIKAQKTPILIQTTDKNRLTMANLYDQYDGNKPFIFGDKNSISVSDTLKVLKTDAPYLGDKLANYMLNTWNECLTFLGINNANTNKRERQIVDEVNANNEMVDLSANVGLLTRNEACAEINKKYGLNISVKMRSLSENEGEKSNVELHN